MQGWSCVGSELSRFSCYSHCSRLKRTAKQPDSTQGTKAIQSIDSNSFLALVQTEKMGTRKQETDTKHIDQTCKRTFVESGYVGGRLLIGKSSAKVEKRVGNASRTFRSTIEVRGSREGEHGANSALRRKRATARMRLTHTAIFFNVSLNAAKMSSCASIIILCFCTAGDIAGGFALPSLRGVIEDAPRLRGVDARKPPRR